MKLARQSTLLDTERERDRERERESVCVSRFKKTRIKQVQDLFKYDKEKKKHKVDSISKVCRLTAR